MPSQAKAQAATGTAAADSTMLFPVSKTIPENYDEIGEKEAGALRTPGKIKTVIE